MRGEVEVWYGDKLIAKESNMIVDGAGKHLADIMTAPSSLSVVESASAILHVSNYSIQAISFGTGKDAFSTNAHYYDDDRKDRIVAAIDGSISDGLAIVDFSAIEGSAYVPEAGLPEEPNPTSTRLEMRDTSMPFDAGTRSVSAVLPGNGQLVNLLPSAIFQSVINGTTLDTALGNKVVGSMLGCFPSDQGTSAVAIFPDGQELSVTMGSSTFNTASSMDYSGFVNKVAIVGGDPEDGLISGGTAPYSDGVLFQVELGPGDLQCANLYGGIYHIGLWTIDMEQSLLNGNTPPFEFDVLNNPRKYRLFCRKGFSIDLTRNEDNGSTPGFTNYGASTNLLIKWRIKFY
jgi:hypothetical protein